MNIQLQNISREDAYIYVLSDPQDHVVRYVGRTNNLIARESGHRNDCLNDGLRQWMNNLPLRFPYGRKFDMTAIIVCPPELAVLAEQVAFTHFQELGCNLFNKHNQNIAGTKTMKQIREMRERLNLTQPEFAELVGKSLRQIQYYEAGEIDVPRHVLKLLEFIKAPQVSVKSLRQLLWQQKQKQNGLCTQCAKPAEAKKNGSTKSRCTECLNKTRAIKKGDATI